MKRKILPRLVPLFLSILGGTVFFVPTSLLAFAPAEMTLSGDWSVQVENDGKTAELAVDLPDYWVAVDERIDKLPILQDGPPWRRGIPVKGVSACECAVFDAIIPETVVVRLRPEKEGGEASEPLTLGVDYQLDAPSGNLGRVEGGKIGPETPVYVSYRSVQMRIDSAVQNSDGSIGLVKGTPHAVNPAPPTLAEGQKRLGNIFIDGRIEKLTEKNLYPILEPAETLTFFDETNVSADYSDGNFPTAKSLLPKTWAKLQNGEPLKILAWGDSVTACGFLPDNDRWQAQFVARLAKRFPKAKIELVTEAWGGRNSDSYFGEPAGSVHNYQEKVLDVHPDLIVSEFVNDSGFDAAKVEKNYGRMRDDFKKIGVEWIILTPHYVRPDWMGFASQRDIDNDPRPYVNAIRAFAGRNGIALAEGSALYGRLWRKGIPYNTLMVNNINHPNKSGMGIFADALMRVFCAPAFSFRPDADSVTLIDGTAPVWRYVTRPISHQNVPETDPRRIAGCYVHPLWGLSGEILTDNAPADHYHHHGIFWTWPHVLLHQPNESDEEFDLWTSNTPIRQRPVRAARGEFHPDGSAILEVENGWFTGKNVADVTAPEPTGGDGSAGGLLRKVMSERVTIITHPAEFFGVKRGRMVEFHFVWTPTDRAITLRGAEEKSYGGFTIRFKPKGKPRELDFITTPEGIAPDDLPERPLAWADFSSRFTDDRTQGAGESGATIFIPETHPDFPPTWLARYYGALCVGWPGVKGEMFEAGEEIRLHYRVFIHDGRLSEDDVKKGITSDAK